MQSKSYSLEYSFYSVLPQKYCIVCKRKSSKRVKLCTVPLTARTQAFIYNGIFTKSSARCCFAHLQGQNFLQPSLAVLEAKYEKSLFNRTDLVNLLENVRLTLKKSSTLDFDNGDSLTTNRGLLQSDWFNQRTIREFVMSCDLKFAILQFEE